MYRSNKADNVQILNDICSLYTVMGNVSVGDSPTSIGTFLDVSRSPDFVNKIKEADF